MLIDILIAILFFIIGFFARWIFFKNKPIGVVRVDQSDPNEKPYLFLELPPGSMDEIMTKDVVTFNVVRENYLK